MKTIYFNNQEEFESSNLAGQYEVVTIVSNEKYNTMCADLMTECKSRTFTDERYPTITITLAQLETEYNEQIQSNELDSNITFNDYIINCTSKNGTLEEIN